MSEPSNQSRLENFTKLFTVILWPGTILIMIIIFWTPLHLIAEKLPGVMDRSEAITIGGMTVKIKKELKQKSPKAISKAINNLSPSAYFSLLELGSDEPDTTSTFSYSTTAWNDGKMNELLRNGLISIVSNTTNQDSIFVRGQEITKFKLTKLGVDSGLFLADIVGVFFKEITKEDSLTTKE